MPGTPGVVCPGGPGSPFDPGIPGRPDGPCVDEVVSYPLATHSN